MLHRDSLEFTTAVALGAALGAGIALLTRSEEKSIRRRGVRWSPAAAGSRKPGRRGWRRPERTGRR